MMKRKLASLSRSAMQAYDILPCPIWLFSIDKLQILASNLAAQDWLEFDAQTLQMMMVTDICPKEHRARLIDSVQQFFGMTANAENWTIIAKSGTCYIATISWSRLVFDGTEAILANVSNITRMPEPKKQIVETAHLHRLINSGVTKQHNQELELRLLQSDFSHPNYILLITEATPIDEPEGPKIVYVNKAFEALTGYSREEVVGNSLRLLQGPKTHKTELNRIRLALEEQQPVSAKITNYSKSGKEYLLEIDIGSITNEDGLITHFVAIARNITETRQAEEALQLREKRLKLLTKATGSTVWEWDVANNSQWWSEGLKDVFGHEMDRNESPPMIWKSHVHPDDKGRSEEAFNQLTSGQIDTVYEKYRFQRADGTWAQVEDRAVIIRDKAGCATHVSGVIWDISQQCAIEERLHQAQKMEVVGQLTAGIAHDFNNLLAVILWNVELFELNNPSDTEREEHIAIKKAITSGTMMTQRLVASSSKAVSAVQSTDIDTRIEDKTDVFIRLLGETINLYYEAESAIWPALVDANRFDDAMYNLVANAKDAMPNGGDVYITAKNIVINAETAAEFGDISAGEFVLITVSDTGSGIPPDLITTVFDPFYTTKQFGESHGLGLSMVYGFAKQSHGHVLMESEINVSTVVKLYLPQAVVPIPNTHKVETKVDTPSLFKGSRILVVEDDLDILNACHRALEMHGFEVITALTGRDAMARLAEGKPFDLLFSDVVLPGDMSGIDVQREALLIQPNMKSILTTGYAELDDLGEQKFTTSANLLHKPYTYRELLDRITIALTLE